MWSVGCIIFEVLNAAFPATFCTYGFDAILFRGDFCNLLSEGQTPAASINSTDMREQIRVIID